MSSEKYNNPPMPLIFNDEDLASAIDDVFAPLLVSDINEPQSTQHEEDTSILDEETLSPRAHPIATIPASEKHEKGIDIPTETHWEKLQAAQKLQSKFQKIYSVPLSPQTRAISLSESWVDKISPASKQEKQPEPRAQKPVSWQDTLESQGTYPAFPSH